MTVIALDNCLICHSSALSVIPTPKRWAGEAYFGRNADRIGLMRCRKCCFVFVNPRPDHSLLDAFYSANTFAADAIGDREQASQWAMLQLREVGRFVSPNHGARLLDYGCGEGQLLRAALAAGWKAVGYDLYRPAIAACQQRGLPVADNLNDIGDERFDVIVLSHVLEHLAAPSHTLEYLKAKLAPDGLLCFEVPNAKSLRAILSYPAFTAWLGFDERYRAFPIHLSYFTARTLLRLLEQHGFAAEQVTTVGLGLDGLIIQRSEQEAAGAQNRAPSVRGPVRRIAIDAFKRTFFGLRMGENLLVIARRQMHDGGGARR